jgi:hypothetical protein
MLRDVIGGALDKKSTFTFFQSSVGSILFTAYAYHREKITISSVFKLDGIATLYLMFASSVTASSLYESVF